MKHQRFRQVLIFTLIALQLVMVYGCSTTSRTTLPGNEIPVGSNFKIVSVILKDGKIIEFDDKGGRYVDKTTNEKSHRVIVGMMDGKHVEIDPDKILEVKIEQEGTSGTGSFIAGFLVGLPFGALALYIIVALSFSGH